MPPFFNLDWLLARLGASLGPVLGGLLLLILLFWGRSLGVLRRMLGGAAAASRRAARKPGQSLCADCAAVLADGSCPECRGRWLKEEELARQLARRRRPERAWSADGPPGGGVACPECGNKMTVGRLSDETFAVERCEACRGLWFGRVEAVSLELRVLG